VYVSLSQMSMKSFSVEDPIYRIADGKIAEIWANADELQQAYQLGLICRRAEAKAAP
jgi:hypothetical protein